MTTRFQTGIYEIICLTNNHRYIGGSRACIMNRFSVHKFALRHNRHSNSLLQRDWNKFGENKFNFRIIKICKPQQVKEFEQQLIDYWDDRNLLYNIQPIAMSSAGVQRTSEQRKRASQSAKARCTSEWRVAVSLRVKKQHKQRRFGKHTWLK